MLSLVSLRFFPGKTRAGDIFEVVLKLKWPIVRRIGAPFPPRSLCSAQDKGHAIPPVIRTFIRGITVCGWFVPTDAAGTLLIGSVRVLYADEVLLRSFRSRVTRS